MASFLEKLKKGMGVDTEDEVKEIKKPAPRVRTLRQAQGKRQAKTVDFKEESAIEPPQVLKIESEPVKTIEIEGISAPAVKEEWFEEPAGQLAVDVYQTEQNLIIQTAIAGIKPENLEVTVERDIVAIRGIRQKPLKENGDYFTKECYWGPFSREIISPVEINPDLVEATMEEGVLTIRLPKILRDKKRTITIKA